MADINDKKLDIIANIADKNPKKAIKRISELKLYEPVDDTLVITSYSIHYTKLYELDLRLFRLFLYRLHLLY